MHLSVCSAVALKAAPCSVFLFYTWGQSLHSKLLLLQKTHFSFQLETTELVRSDKLVGLSKSSSFCMTLRKSLSSVTACSLVIFCCCRFADSTPMLRKSCPAVILFVSLPSLPPPAISLLPALISLTLAIVLSLSRSCFCLPSQERFQL